MQSRLRHLGNRNRMLAPADCDRKVRVPSTLEAMVAVAKRDGWAEGSGRLLDVLLSARHMGLKEVPNRRGGSLVSTLRPVSTEEAHPRSLSALYGKGAQPLHTDGAHLFRPPDFILLTCEEPSPTPTVLWIGKDLYGLPSDLSHGIFLVSNDSDSFFAPALEKWRRLRYDPGCMVPCDARAAKAARFFEEAISSSKRIPWDSPRKLLLINNHTTLHARAAVTADDENRELQRIGLVDERRKK
jgi:hypothetical protein